jgi:hypothetical protein
MKFNPNRFAGSGSDLAWLAHRRSAPVRVYVGALSRRRPAARPAFAVAAAAVLLISSFV